MNAIRTPVRTSGNLHQRVADRDDIPIFFASMLVAREFRADVASEAVRAINAHDALVAACEAALPQLVARSGWELLHGDLNSLPANAAAIEKVQAALDLARGEDE